METRYVVAVDVAVEAAMEDMVVAIVLAVTEVANIFQQGVLLAVWQRGAPSLRCYKIFDATYTRPP